MLKYVAAGLPTLVIFLLLDALWIGLVALPQFRVVLGDALFFRAAPSIVFYIIYIGGILFFASTPAFATGQWSTALVYGLVFGFCAYATYDLTNYATLRPWTLGLAIADIAWGSFVTGVAACLGYIASFPVLRMMQ